MLQNLFWGIKKIIWEENVLHAASLGATTCYRALCFNDMFQFRYETSLHFQTLQSGNPLHLSSRKHALVFKTTAHAQPLKKKMT